MLQRQRRRAKSAYEKQSSRPEVRQLGQFGGELVDVGHGQAVGHLGDVLVAEVSRRLRDLTIDQLEERRVVGGQDESEAQVGVAPRPTSLRRRADLGDDLQHALHRVGVDARALVEDAIDGRGPDAGAGGDFSDGGRGRHAAWSRMPAVSSHR